MINFKLTNKRYEERKQLHVCLRCETPLPPDDKRQYCEECREKSKIAYQKKKEERKNLRICFSCGKKLSNAENFKCKTCAEKLRLNQYGYNDKTKLEKALKAKPKYCMNKNCNTIVDRHRKYCPKCKEESLKLSKEKSKIQIRERQRKQKEFYLQLEIKGLKENGNYLGFNLKRIRDINRISVLFFSVKIHINTQTLINIETGEIQIDLPKFIEIMHIFEITPDMFGIKNEDYDKLFIKFKTEVIDINKIKNQS